MHTLYSRALTRHAHRDESPLDNSSQFKTLFISTVVKLRILLENEHSWSDCVDYERNSRQKTGVNSMREVPYAYFLIHSKQSVAFRLTANMRKTVPDLLHKKRSWKKCKILASRMVA